MGLLFDCAGAEVNLVDDRYPFGEVRDGRLVVSGEMHPPDMLDESDTQREMFDAEARNPHYAGDLQSLLLGCNICKVSSELSSEPEFQVIIHAMIVQELTPESDTFRRLGISRQYLAPVHEVSEPLTRHGEYRRITLV